VFELKGSIRKRVTYANVASTIAVVIAISGGTAYAASHLITGKQIAKSTITSANVKSHSLLASNFKKGQIPAGATGPMGPQGAAGLPGVRSLTAISGSTETATRLSTPPCRPVSLRRRLRLR
jgi:hypothetical protein